MSRRPCAYAIRQKKCARRVIDTQPTPIRSRQKSPKESCSGIAATLWRLTRKPPKRRRLSPSCIANKSWPFLDEGQHDPSVSVEFLILSRGWPGSIRDRSLPHPSIARLATNTRVGRQAREHQEN